MAKLNENYEAVVIFSMKQGEESIKESVEKFAALIRDNGTLESVDEWAKELLLTKSTMKPRATTSCTTSTAFLPSPTSWRED